MNKAKTGKLLSAAAVANMAVAGFAAAPAGAATHSAAGTAGGAVAKATISVTKSRGFVPRAASGSAPRAASGVRPFSESGFNGHMWFSLHGGGNHVSYTLMSFFSTTGCHIPWVSVVESGVQVFNSHGPYTCPGVRAKLNFNNNWPTGADFCGHFQNVTGKVCEPVR